MTRLPREPGVVVSRVVAITVKDGLTLDFACHTLAAVVATIVATGDRFDLAELTVSPRRAVAVHVVLGSLAVVLEIQEVLIIAPGP